MSMFVSAYFSHTIFLLSGSLSFTLCLSISLLLVWVSFSLSFHFLSVLFPYLLFATPLTSTLQ